MPRTHRWACQSALLLAVALLAAPPARPCAPAFRPGGTVRIAEESALIIWDAESKTWVGDFRPYDLFRNPRLVGNAVGKLIPRRSVGNPGRYGQHAAEELSPIVIVAEIQTLGRPIEQVL